MRIYLFMMRTARSISGPENMRKALQANLYEVLREMDEMGVQKMYSESFAGGGLGAAIMNRLLKAAGHHVIRV